MPWVAAAAAIAPSVIGAFSGGGGSSGPRGVNLTSEAGDPFASQARTEALAAQQQQQNFLNQLQAQGGVQNQSNVFNQQQGLANQLQMQSQGGGPNPAQAMLAQNTSANTANQASLMAGQRGASQNVGLMARQIGQQGAANQQQSVGQAATLQAQQQLAFQQQLQQQQAMMSGLSTNQVSQAQTGVQNQTQAVQNQQAMQLQNLQNWNAVNASAAAGQGTQAVGYAQLAQQKSGALAGGIGAGLGALGGADKANGGMIGYAHGGMPQSRYGQHVHGMSMKQGGHVPGKAQVKGDSPENDTVPAMLSPGEGVINRETMQRSDEVGRAARFVMAAVQRQKHSK